uniref:cytochrome c oxidase subunit III n=1 Tax=Uroobovella oviformis TaxID=3106009 RepID=UPI002E77C31A|nr:cytochrome c oxidase subunit III [Uroobovella oviformis]WPV72074.1 cytochrome c oxidase subunit III [Uroobovella oviformis]
MSYHAFHMVEKSPWPITGAISTLTILMSLITMMHNNSYNMMMLAIMITILTMFQWWRDVIRESAFQGCHTLMVLKGLKMGMLLFILSEILFFFSFFWAFFHASLSPNIELGVMWPPTSIMPFNPFHIPLLNTIILLSSGATVTWSHHAILYNNYKNSLYALMMTILLGIYFTFLQYLEYKQAIFTISDSVFGSLFFVMTGFHGLHVIIGTLFLIVNAIRIIMNHLSSEHHFSFEAASWYWHFVDVVWLFLYICVYWWSF